MMWGRRWMSGRWYGRRGRCWQMIYELAKELGEDVEKYLYDPRPGWMILNELLRKKEAKKGNSLE